MQSKSKCLLVFDNTYSVLHIAVSCCWSLLCSSILRSRADSLRPSLPSFVAATSAPGRTKRRWSSRGVGAVPRGHSASKLASPRSGWPTRRSRASIYAGSHVSSLPPWPQCKYAGSHCVWIGFVEVALSVKGRALLGRTYWHRDCLREEEEKKAKR